LIDERDGVTGGHAGRAAQTLEALIKGLLDKNLFADELRLADIGMIAESSQLHDIGKISIRDDILLKKDKLNAGEYEIMKRHVENGVIFIEQMKHENKADDFLAYAKTMIKTHHEKWDGTGYPYGLAGVNIPLCGRLMAIADAYDVLTSERPYKKACSHKKAMRIITESSGTHFDPMIAGVFPEIICVS
jgi:putative two-component system response regulator